MLASIAARSLSGAAVTLLLAGASAAPAPAATAARDQSIVARALARKGYQSTAVRCRAQRNGTSCTWTALRKLATCRGRALVGSRGHRRTLLRLTSGCERLPGTVTPGRTDFGFNTFVSPDTIRLQREIGATTTRLIMSWSLAEPLPGVWSWGVYDQNYADLLKAGLPPLIMVYDAPCWARLAAGCAEGVTTAPPAPSFDGQWSAFVREVARRYPKAIGIEIWNEPNLDTFFWPRADPSRYAALLREAYGAVKQVAPAMPVISGGLLTTKDLMYSGPGGLGPKAFLEGVYRAGGGPYMDAIGIHPYPVIYKANDQPLGWDPARVETVLDALRSVRDAAGGRAKSLWITEVGESTTTQPGFAPAVSPSVQARDLVAVARSLIRDPDVAVAIIHTLLDSYPDLAQDTITNVAGSLTGFDVFYNEANEGFGIFTPSRAPKPAACALSPELGGSLRC